MANPAKSARPTDVVEEVSVALLTRSVPVGQMNVAQICTVVPSQVRIKTTSPLSHRFSYTAGKASSHPGFRSSTVMATRSTRASRRVYDCGLYVPGHDVHWIQALHAGADTENPGQPGRLIDVNIDGTLVVDVAGSQRRLWNHDPSRLGRLAARNAWTIEYQPRSHLHVMPSV
jgi:hypothetical protein